MLYRLYISQNYHAIEKLHGLHLCAFEMRMEPLPFNSFTPTKWAPEGRMRKGVRFINKPTTAITEDKSILFKLKYQFMTLNNETDEIFNEWKITHLSNIYQPILPSLFIMM